MNLKSKISGFAVATALSLSIMTGAMASETATQDVSVKLDAAPACAVYITNASGDFGTWQYSGETDQYVKPNDTTVDFTAKLLETKPDGLCKLTLGFSGIKNGNDTIGASNFSGSVTGPQGTKSGKVPAGAFGNGVPVVLPGSNNYTGSLTLDSITGSAQKWAPGTYNGTVSVTITGAQ